MDNEKEQEVWLTIRIKSALPIETDAPNFAETFTKFLRTHGEFTKADGKQSFSFLDKSTAIEVLKVEQEAEIYTLNGKPDEISKMLTLSTAHIRRSTSELLQFKTDDVPFCFDKTDAGWIVLVSDKAFGTKGVEIIDPLTVPSDLKTVLAYARSLGCEWLCLDRDGDVNPNLPTWEW
jgi:hypothetical protein